MGLGIVKNDGHSQEKTKKTSSNMADSLEKKALSRVTLHCTVCSFFYDSV